MSGDHPSDAELVARAQRGDDEGFRLLVLRWQTPLYRFLLRLASDPELAEDLAQETFLKAYRGLGGYDPRRPLKSWLFKIAHNTMIDHVRRRGVATVALETEGEESFDPLDRISDPGAGNPEATARGRDLARDLTTAVGALQPHYRELVLLRYQEGMSYGEIAEITGLPLGTVKIRLHRGRKQLADILAARGWSPGDDR